MRRAHEHVQNALDRVHDVNMAAMQHSQAMQQTAQQGQIASDAAAQQAALQPQPMEGAGA